jgi:dienelactone hydrolase
VVSRFSNKVYLQGLAAHRAPELAFPIDYPEKWSEWRTALRYKLDELLGGIPPRRSEVSAELLERREEDGYTRDRIAFISRDGQEVPAYLLTPVGEGPPGGRRAVLCLHGHGRGKDDVVGEPGAGTADERAANLEHIVEHNYDYARRFAQLGFVVLAPDARGFGERSEGSENEEARCYVPGVISLFLGRPITGQRLCDDLSAVDYLSSLPGVDAGRIGCIGLSEGGKRTLYLAASDERIRAAVISGYFSTLTGAIREWDKLAYWDICNYVPGLLRYADYPDLAALIAPRPLLIENAVDDALYDQPAVQEAVDKTARAYAVHGAAERFDVDMFTGGHKWSGQKSFAWIDRWL